MNVKLCVRALLCLILTYLHSHTPIHGQALRVGDAIPDELWDLPLDLINHPSGKQTITLSEYKDKLIILDFWATWCSPCVAMLPKQDSLQKQFNTKIQIIPVSYESGDVVRTFLEKLSKRKGFSIDLPKVVNNRNLKPYFEHATIPHYVWIKEGKVKAITGYREVDADNLSKMLSAENLNLKVKSQTPNMGYPSGEVSLMEYLAYQKPEHISDFNFRSSLSRYIPGLGGELNILKPSANQPFWRITATNVSLKSLYQYAYGAGADFVNAGTIAVEVLDTNAIRPTRSVTDFKAWLEKYAFCFELIVPQSRSAETFKLFQDQLDSYFPRYLVAIEKRPVRVLALEKTGEIPIKESSATKFAESYDGFTYRFTGGRLLVFVRGLNYYFSGLSTPVIDLTGFEGKIDLQLEAKMNNIAELNSALKSHGLILREKVEAIPVLVIKDRQ